jgi:hypothetical protein
MVGVVGGGDVLERLAGEFVALKGSEQGECRGEQWPARSSATVRRNRSSRASSKAMPPPKPIRPWAMRTRRVGSSFFGTPSSKLSIR